MRYDQIGIRLKQKLAGATYGDPTRVYGAADFEAISLGGKPVDVPAIYVIPEDTTYENETDDKGSFSAMTMIERVSIVVVLSSQVDTKGEDPIFLIHDIRQDILGAIFGFNPSINSDQIDGIPYGYQSGELRPSHDDELTHNDEWYQHRFEYYAMAQINSECQGTGGTNPDPEHFDPLEHINAKIEPSTISPDLQPAKEANITFP